MMAVHENRRWQWHEIGFCFLAAGFVLVLHGAVPFLMMPTLGQAIWSMGFSQSFANGPWLSLYAHDFGAPAPAAIAFGLAGAWPASLFIRLGMHAGDAYSAMAALWLLIAFASCYGIGRQLGATRVHCLLGGVTWMTMPIIWAHSGYSMLSLGLALLPFYMLAALRLFVVGASGWPIAPKAGLYLVVGVISVFMDGYSFMMFAVGASILLVYFVATQPEKRQLLLRVVLPVHVLCFGAAYLAYAIYIGKSIFQPYSMDFFRGWGLDLSYVVIPTREKHWIPDALGLSLRRTDYEHFGDGSVWDTTFFLPLLIAGILAWWRLRIHKFATAVLVMGVLGFYMALGPSLKVNSTKPESLQISHPRQQSALMPAELAIMPTGTAWISANFPGFNVMRASYRWVALCIFSLWLLLIVKLSRSSRSQAKPWAAALLGITLVNLPAQGKWHANLDARRMFHQMEAELVATLQSDIHPGEMVAFVPWGNDFLVNYLAPKVGFRTFNIGGDKNLADAQRAWPRDMLLLTEPLHPGQALTMVKMLVNKDADALVLPYFHPLFSAHVWPCWEETEAWLSKSQREEAHHRPVLECAADRKKMLEPFATRLKDLAYIEITESDLYAVARLRPEFMGNPGKIAFARTIQEEVHYPISFGNKFTESTYCLHDGWYAPEAGHVWSAEKASLLLPLPESCKTGHCVARMTFDTFGASPDRPVRIMLESMGGDRRWSKEIMATSAEAMEVRIPLSGEVPSDLLSIFIPAATSPRELRGSLDDRVLGIAVRRIDLDVLP